MQPQAILPLYKRSNIDFSYGDGVYLYTKSGQKYLDFASGYAATALGHCHPALVEAITKQANTVWHLSNCYKVPGMEEYSQRLVDLSFGDTVFLANSGAEAVECMIKMARRYFNARGEGQRYRIITIDGAFHGRTLATASAGAKGKMEGFEPSVDGFDRVPWEDLVALQKAIKPSTAGILLEPIQGEGGMRAHTQEYMAQVQKLCRQYDLLLLVDEVQSGMGRSGYMFAYQMYGLKPDLMALGKGLGSGFPISACIATWEVGRHMKVGSHGSTFGGNPLALAVGKAVLDIMTEPGFLPHVNRVALYLKDKLQNLCIDYPDKIEEITGSGLMLGIKLKGHINIDDFTETCREFGLLSIPSALNTMRLTPPLIINEDHCDEAINKLGRVLTEMGTTKHKVIKTIKNAIGKLGL